MKAITPNKTPKTDAKAPAPKAAKSPRKQAQCCAKVSRITAGCHD